MTLHITNKLFVFYFRLDFGAFIWHGFLKQYKDRWIGFGIWPLPLKYGFWHSHFLNRITIDLWLFGIQFDLPWKRKE